MLSMPASKSTAAHGSRYAGKSAWASLAATSMLSSAASEGIGPSFSRPPSEPPGMALLARFAIGTLRAAAVFVFGDTLSRNNGGGLREVGRRAGGAAASLLLLVLLAIGKPPTSFVACGILDGGRGG